MGSFPLHFEQKLHRLLGEPEKVLHPFGGLAEIGDTVDLNETTTPTWVGDAHDLHFIEDESYDLVILDPPYSDEEAEWLYSTPPLRRTVYTAEAVRVCKTGGHVAVYQVKQPARPKGTRLKIQFSVDALKRLAALALTAVLLTACGGGAAVDGAKVEDSLRDYLFAINPEQSSFPSGAGAPRVRHKACTDQHVKVQKGQVLSGVAGMWGARFREEVALWSCVVTFGSLALPTTVAVTGSTEVVWAVALPFEGLVMNIFLQDLNTVGAGPPREKGNSCKKIGKPARLPGFVRPAHLAFWSCVVRFAHPPFHVRVALKDNGQIAWAMLVPRQST